MTKKYTLTTSEETVTENPEDIIRLMKLAGLSNAQAVAEEEVNEEVYEPTEANDELDLDDYSKKSPESISKQKKSLDKAPSKGDNPLEYSLDENEIYEAMMKEFNETEEVIEETEEVIEESKPDFLDLDKDGDKEESMKKAAKDKKEKADESVEEMSVSELKEAGNTKEEEIERIARLEKRIANLKKSNNDEGVDLFQRVLDQARRNVKNMSEGTPGCADCEWIKDETDGDIDTCDECAAEKNESVVTEDKSVWADFKKAYETMDLESEDRMFFSMKNWSGHRFEIQSDIEGENGTVVLGMHVADEDGEPDFLQNRKFALSDIEANITGAGWYADGGTVLKTTIGDFEGMDMEEEEVTEPNESSDMDRLKKLSGM